MERLKLLFTSEEGYFTVEAAFLVPLVILLLFLVMESGLYLCDLNQAKSFLNVRITQLSASSQPYEADALQEDKERIKKKLFVTNVSDFSIKKSKNKVEGTLRISMRFPVLGEWVGKFWNAGFTFAADIGDNAEQMRRWSQLE